MTTAVEIIDRSSDGLPNTYIERRNDGWYVAIEYTLSRMEGDWHGPLKSRELCLAYSRKWTP